MGQDSRRLVRLAGITTQRGIDRGLAQVVSQADPNAGGLTWDQAAKKLATGECAFPVDERFGLWGARGQPCRRRYRTSGMCRIPEPPARIWRLWTPSWCRRMPPAWALMPIKFFMATIADPTTSLEFSKVKGSVPIRRRRRRLDAARLPAPSVRIACGTTRYCCRSPTASSCPPDFQQAVYDAVATFVQEQEHGRVHPHRCRNSIQVPDRRTMTRGRKAATGRNGS